MSEQPTTAPRSRDTGNVFTRKIGPLQMWIWMVIVLLLAVFYYLYRKNHAANASTGGASTVNSPGGVDSSLVPQFVNQTYVNNAPPASPSVPTSSAGKSETFSKGHIIKSNHSKAEVGWSSSDVGAQGATQLKVELNGPGQDKTHPIVRYVPASATSATFDNLLKNHNYQVEITPVDASGHAVGKAGVVDLKTT